MLKSSVKEYIQTLIFNYFYTILYNISSLVCQHKIQEKYKIKTFIKLSLVGQ